MVLLYKCYCYSCSKDNAKGYKLVDARTHRRHLEKKEKKVSPVVKNKEDLKKWRQLLVPKPKCIYYK